MAVFIDRHYVGRSNIRMVTKPVVGWRAREIHQASTKWGAKWRWTHSHLAEVVRMEWALRASRRKLSQEDGDAVAVKMKYGRQQEHVARLLVKIGKRGMDLLEELGGPHEWRVRWMAIVDMAEQVVGDGDLDVSRLRCLGCGG